MRWVLLGHSSIQTTQRYQHLESNDVSPKAVVILNQQNVERNRSKLKIVGGKSCPVVDVHPIPGDGTD